MGVVVRAWGEPQLRSPRSQPNLHIQVHDLAPFQSSAPSASRLPALLTGGGPEPRGDPRTNLNVAPLSFRSPNPEGQGATPATPRVPGCGAAQHPVAGGGRRRHSSAHSRHLVRNRWGRRAPGDRLSSGRLAPLRRQGSDWRRTDVDGQRDLLTRRRTQDLPESPSPPAARGLPAPLRREESGRGLGAQHRGVSKGSRSAVQVRPPHCLDVG